MTYQRRLSLLLLLDSAIVLFAIYVSFFMLNPYVVKYDWKLLLISSLSLLLSHHVFGWIYHLYNRAWSYASVRELVVIVKAVTFSILAAGSIQFLIQQDVYFRLLVITWMLHIILIGGSRFSWRMLRDSYIKPKTDKKRALVVGAGAAGAAVVKQLQHSEDSDLEPVAFVDDDVKKYKLQLHGIKVEGTVADIADVIFKHNIDQIIIAIPSLGKKELQRIYEECAKTNAKTKILPLIEDVMTGKVSVSEFRDVEVEDLLGREPVELDIQSISEMVSGQTVLVTGAGGSIGSEICRQVSKFTPSQLLLLGHGENSIYQIDMELRKAYGTRFEIVPLIADIQDRERIMEIMSLYQPHVVYHAAAHKHVPLMEYNPQEAVKNNVIGTKNVAEAADIAGVGTFVMVSTDKAVNPTNVMGSTKRIAEMVVQNLALTSPTRFVAVRFGNVLGSRGSVIPLFKKQIQAGGPVTVTHPDMTRYFMTIPEASRLVLQAGALARGGEIFVLDMGEPVKIVDLARNLIRLSGYTIEEIGIEFSGIRPGEKMYEELLGEDEVHSEAVFPKIFVGKSVLEEYEKVVQLIEGYETFDREYLREFVLGLANHREKELLEVAR
ncbi:polysaccharide biosynthesis protein EpsC [Bacillus coahuilensis m2-6]|uniref:Polysaccharide biosynthesis protein EpsC n=1 Tax=Bacillus coahuilensis p1.1.43 TaxID=1150625 RepID=A0A147K4J0_9BACI|nr:nucleoside-diphosphate sugar epimerase/dehydratase [Bacillus coahuilensis]KUP04307.1 polysaccharide biosynthesis protein EpsC [Bacillus coahuilensis p1.1.43]KUP05099.1 polysaccharide biosynthesis protein EpsC [Bacillus coahuilensis m2-6]